MNPEEDASEIDLDEAIGAALQTLPQPVRAFLTGNERDAIARELTAKYSLRVDQAGEFERVLILMLLGIISPEEFTEMLGDVGLAPNTISELAAEVNNRIFIPLRLAQTKEQHYQTTSGPQKPPVIPPPAIAYNPAPTLPGSPMPAPMPRAVEPIPPNPQTPLPPTQPWTQPASAQETVQPFVPNQPMPPYNGYSWQPAAAVHIFTPGYAVPYPGQPQPVSSGTQPMHAPQNPVYAPAPTNNPSVPQASVQYVPETRPDIAPAPEQRVAAPVPILSNTPPPAPAMPPLQSFARAPEVPQSPPAHAYSSDPYRESV